MAIHVYHNTEGSSDKYWAISDALDANGHHEVWYGRRGSKLTATTRAESKHWSALAQEKLSKGYIARSSLTVDRKSQKVVPLTKLSDLPPVELEPVKQLAYFVVKPWDQELAADVDLKLEVCQLRSGFIEAVKSFDPTLAKLDFSSLPDYSDSVSDNTLYCEIEFNEGPLAFLFLFVLKHQLADRGFEVLIANNDTSVQYNPSQEDGLFADVRNEWLEDHTEMPNDGITATTVRDACIKLADRIFFDQLCIAVGSKDAPFSLSSIEAPSKAAFF